MLNLMVHAWADPFSTNVSFPTWLQAHTHAPDARHPFSHDMHFLLFIRRSVVAAAPLLLLASCGSSGRHSALDDIAPLVRDRTGAELKLPRTQLEQRDVDARVSTLLRQRLTAGQAVQIALLSNPRLRATLEELNLSQADLMEASQLRNPSLATSLRFPNSGGGSNSEFGLSGDVLDWLLTPLKRRLALREYEAAKKRVSHEVLNLAADVKEAFYEVQARQQFLNKLATATEVSEVSSDIANRLHKAGNINALELLQEQTSTQQVALEQKRAQAELRTAREKVSRLLGLGSTDAARWIFVDALPAMPASDPSPGRVETLALEQRQDLAAQNEVIAAYEHALSLKRKTRVIPGLNLGVNTEREPDGAHLTGPTLDLELPVFNWGQAGLRRAEAELAQARATRDALQNEVLSDVRQAVNEVRSAREIYEHVAETLLPQRQKILAETLLHYNAMQVSNFVLLRAKEDVVKAEHDTIDALHAYWTARTELEKAAGGSLASKPRS